MTVSLSQETGSKTDNAKIQALSNTEGGGKVGAGVTGSSWLG